VSIGHIFLRFAFMQNCEVMPLRIGKYAKPISLNLGVVIDRIDI